MWFASLLAFLSSLSNPSLSDASLAHLQALDGSEHASLADALSLWNEAALGVLPEGRVLRLEDALAGLLEDFD